MAQCEYQAEYLCSDTRVRGSASQHQIKTQMVSLYTRRGAAARRISIRIRRRSRTRTRRARSGPWSSASPSAHNRGQGIHRVTSQLSHPISNAASRVFPRAELTTQDWISQHIYTHVRAYHGSITRTSCVRPTVASPMQRVQYLAPPTLFGHRTRCTTKHHKTCPSSQKTARGDY